VVRFGGGLEDFDVLDVAPSAEEVERNIREVGVGKKWRPAGYGWNSCANAT
jgi:hypothetical protein